MMDFYNLNYEGKFEDLFLGNIDKLKCKIVNIKEKLNLIIHEQNLI